MARKTPVIVSICLIMILTACSSTSPAPSLTPIPASPTIEKITTVTLLEPSTTPASTHLPRKTPFSTQTPPLTPTNILIQTKALEPTRTPPPLTLTLTPTQTPTLTPTVLPELLAASIVLQPAEGVKDHPMRQITGCEGGIYDYQWFGNNHLLLYPLIGLTNNEDYWGGTGIISHSLPIVISLSDAQRWLPIPNGPTDTPGLVFWLDKLEEILAFQWNESLLYDLNGNVIARLGSGYPYASNVDISPSKQWLLTEDFLLTLERGEWETIDLPGDWFGFPAWTADETYVFKCCYGLTNLKTGQSTDFKLDGLEQVGRGLSPGGGIGSIWVLNDTQVMIGWDFEGYKVPLINPFLQTYIDLRVPAGLVPLSVFCSGGFATSDGNWALLWCENGNHLFDLRAMKLKTTISFEDGWRGWSPDNRYLLFTQNQKNETDIEGEAFVSGEYFLLPVSSGEMITVTEQTLREPGWGANGGYLVALTADGQTIITFAPDTQALTPFHLRQPASLTISWNPQRRFLAVLGNDGQTLSLLNTIDNTLRQVNLPTAARMPGTWNPTGKYLALTRLDDKGLYIINATSGTVNSITLAQPPIELLWGPYEDELAIREADGRLEWLPKASLSTIELLSPPLPGVSNPSWSPNGNQIAFVSGGDIYIVIVR
jgi:WD40 repeat protein